MNSKIDPMKQIEMYDQAIEAGGSEIKRYVLPVGRTKCIFSDHSIIQVRRGEKFCDPKRGESPDDLLPKLALRFKPIDPRVTEKIPEDHECDIGFIFNVAFGPKAKLPPFLTSFSKDGNVPKFTGGQGLYNWLNQHLDHVYLVGHKPNDAGDRNYGTSIAWVSEPLMKKGTSKVPGQAKIPVKDDELTDAFVGTVDLTGEEEEDQPPV